MINMGPNAGHQPFQGHGWESCAPMLAVENLEGVYDDVLLVLKGTSLTAGRRLGVAHRRVNWATTGAWSDSGNFTSVRKAPDSSGRYSLWISVWARVASSAREAST
jgi:hypothetical protein